MLRWLTILALALAATAEAATVAHLTLPAISGWGSQTHSGTANQLVCARVVALDGIDDATRLAGGIPTAQAGQTCGFAVYPDSDGGTALASVSGSCAATGIISATGLTAYDITEGVVYRVCACSTGTTSAYQGVAQGATTAGHAGDLLNAFTTQIGTAANACATGAPPSTTGALTVNDTFRIPVVVVE